MKHKYEIKLVIMIVTALATIIISVFSFFSIINSPANNIQVPINFTSTSNPIMSDSSGAVQVRDFLQPFISATLDGSDLSVLIDKVWAEQLNENRTYPFKWGVHLTSGFGDDKKSNYIIELELCVDDTGGIIETKASSYTVTDSETMELVCENISKVDANIDGTNYIISCDITNDYIPTDDICINTIFHY